jgi:amidase
MAHHAADLALELDVLAGPDLPDTTGYRMALPPARHADALRPYRVLVLDSHPVAPTGNAVRAALAGLADRLTRAGCSVTEKSALLPDLARVARLYTLVLSSFAGVDDPGYDRVQQAAASIPADATDLSALRVRGTVLSLRDWTRADRERWQIQQQWRELFRSFDVVVCPAFPVVAFPHDHSAPRDDRKLDIDGRAYRYIDDIRPWLGVASLTGLPVTTAPIARSPEGLPIGVQIIGPEFEDRTPIEFARLIEREFGGFVAPPGFA